MQRLLPVLLSAALSCAVVAPPAATAEVANPAVGVNLKGISYYESGLVFIDHMKVSAPWYANGVPRDAIARDARGWPTALPWVGGRREPVRTLTLSPHALHRAGRYVLTYKGEGDIRAHGDARLIEAESRPGRQVYDVIPSRSGIHVTISRTQAGNHVRSVKLMREELVPAYEAGARYLPEYLDTVKDFRTLRFMEWMVTNGSDVRRYADRPYGSAATFMDGVPLYRMIDLANRAGADPWFTLPHLADDDYVRRFARTVRARLDPRLKAHFEYSNEVWNTSFGQGRWAQAQGRAAFGARARLPETQFYAKRACEMADILDEVYAGERHRLVKVISTQTVWPDRTEVMLDAPAWTAKGGRSVADRFDALAVATYFGDPGSGPVGDAALGRWAHEGAWGRSQILREIETGAVLGDAATVVTVEELPGVLEAQGEIARRHGLRLLAYEGGLHLTARGPAGGDPAVERLIRETARDPRMGVFYDRMFAAWRAAGGEVSAHHADVSVVTKWGAWGLIERLGDVTPRLRAVQRANRAAPPWTAGRAANAFADGRTVIDDGRTDRLVGGPGADVFRVEGATVIEGGEGVDTARLPSVPGGYWFRREGPWTLAYEGNQLRHRLSGVERIKQP